MVHHYTFAQLKAKYRQLYADTEIPRNPSNSDRRILFTRLVHEAYHATFCNSCGQLDEHFATLGYKKGTENIAPRPIRSWYSYEHMADVAAQVVAHLQHPTEEHNETNTTEPAKKKLKFGPPSTAQPTLTSFFKAKK